MDEGKLKVVFVGGCSRSGSTLLARMLAQVRGFLEVGELHQIWRMSFGQNNLCGCGETFRDCPFWSRVVEEAFGGRDRVDLRRMRALRHSVSRVWRRPPLLRRLLATGSYRGKLREYAEVVGRLLEAVQRVGAAEVIADSSKTAHQGAVLSAAPNVELHVVHVIRDSRAVAYSMQRVKAYPGPDGREAYMPRSGWVKSAALWRRENRAIEALKGRAASFTALRYEDLVDRPREHLRQILLRVTGQEGDLDFVRDGEVTLRPGHSLSGNPMRFEQGRIEIRSDTEWQQRMPRRGRLLVTALTWDLLRAYGYRREAHP